MDPLAALLKARAATTRTLALVDNDSEYVDTGELIDAARDLAESFEALDGWIANGGFLPEGWAR